MIAGYQTLPWANYYKEYDLEKVLKSIGTSGFKGIEFIEPISKLDNPSSLKSILERNGLKAASISCGLNMDAGDTADIDEAKSRIDFAADLGVKDIMLCGGWLSDTVGKDKNSYEILAGKLGTCCEYASGLDMNIAFHPHKDTIVETSQDIERLLEFTDRPKLCIDIAHLAACGSDPADAIKKFREVTTYIHLKDWDLELNDFVELGEGEVDITRCLSVLKDVGYDSWTVVELDHTKRTPEESLRINADYLRRAGII